MINFNDLTEEQKEQLRKQVKAEEVAKAALRKNKIKEYKELTEELVGKNFMKAIELAKEMNRVKKEIFEEFATLLELKKELYGIKEAQQSHTFTDSKFRTLTIGHRILDNFDDTVHTGIAKVKSYINRLTAGENPQIEELVNLLLKKDKNGNLKANRVLELERIANKIDDEELKEGVQIIKEAYKPVKSSSFIEVYYKDKNGRRVNIPLTMTGTGDLDEIEFKDNESTD